MQRRYLVSGGAGFIGSNFIRYLLSEEPHASVINIDAMAFTGVASTVHELSELGDHTFIKGDIRDRELVGGLMNDVDIVVNFAAESHVDRSIEAPIDFVDTNVTGTTVLLSAAMRARIGTFVQVSTDEVYGSLPGGAASEGFPLAPSSPYAASKASADLLVEAFRVTYGFPATITRCTNNYGPYQFPEKVIPLFITNGLDGLGLPVYGTGEHQRDWLHVRDHCAALHLLVDSASEGETYNIGTGTHITNVGLAKMIMDELDLDESLLEYVNDRPGHDLRYSVDTTKIRDLGWEPRWNLMEGIADTIAWYRHREDWWRPLKARLS